MQERNVPQNWKQGLLIKTGENKWIREEKLQEESVISAVSSVLLLLN